MRMIKDILEAAMWIAFFCFFLWFGNLIQQGPYAWTTRACILQFCIIVVGFCCLIIGIYNFTTRNDRARW